MKRAGRAALALLLALACSPRNNGTLLVVEVNTDLRPPQVNNLVIEARPDRGAGVSEQFELRADTVLPVRLALVPEGSPDLAMDVVAQARLDATTLVSLTARVSFTSGQARGITLFLAGDCASEARRRACQDTNRECLGGGRCAPKEEVATPYPLDDKPDAAPPTDASDPRDAPAVDARADVPGADGAMDGPRDAAPPDRPGREAGVTGTWTTVAAAPVIPPTAVLNSVWPVRPDEVWVVGNVGPAGVAYRYDGQAWTAALLPAGTRPLYGVWASGPNDVWAVGLNNTVVRRTDTGWSPVTTPLSATTPVVLTSVWGASANEVWIAGQGSTVLRWNGNAVMSDGDGVSGDLGAITGNGDGDLWTVGNGGVVYSRRGGGSWQRQRHDLTATILYAVWAGGGHVWIGGEGVTLHFDGTRWSSHTGAPATALGIWAANADDVWAVGPPMGRSPIARWDGTAWVETPSPAMVGLQSVRGTAASSVWAVGNAGTVLRFLPR